MIPELGHQDVVAVAWTKLEKDILRLLARRETAALDVMTLHVLAKTPANEDRAALLLQSKSATTSFLVQRIDRRSSETKGCRIAKRGDNAA